VSRRSVKVAALRHGDEGLKSQKIRSCRHD
jgi:hypothetical protein